MLLSIIIPVYNLQEYIEDCLKSCLDQDFNDYEIICVNDGSKDDSAVILDRYAEMYPQIIRVIHKENGGVSSARNIGLEHATGRWIWFVDGDDYIAPKCVKVFAENLTEAEDFILLDLDKGELGDLPELTQEELLSSKIEYAEAFRASASKSYAGGAYSYWFKKEILDRGNIRFDERMKYSEDVKFIFQYKLLAKNGGRLFDNVVYFYRSRQGSAMHSVDYEQQISCMNILAKLYHEAMLQNPSLHDVFLNKQLQAMQVIQFNLLFKIRNYNRAKEQLTKWEREGLYPYRIPKLKKKKRKKITSGLKYRLFDALKNFFGRKSIYMFLCRVVCKN